MVGPSTLKQATALQVSDAAEGRARRRGILMACGALLCFSCLDTTAKWLGHSLPVWQVIWARYAMASLFALMFVNPLTTPGVLMSSRIKIQLLRSFLLLASTALNFFALRSLQLAETISISFSMPLVVALLAGPLLGEWVGRQRLVAILVGFLGVLIVTLPNQWPNQMTLQPAVLFSIVGVFAYAGYVLLTRLLARHDPARTTLIYSTVAGILVVTPLLPFLWVWPPDLAAWLLMAFMGFCGTFGHWLLILAHERAPAAVLAPFVYTQILWMSALGYLVFGDIPGPLTMIGAAIVIASGVYLWRQERHPPIGG
jgi:drug/metabolite transporter (DMT)-like permease